MHLARLSAHLGAVGLALPVAGIVPILPFRDWIALRDRHLTRRRMHRARRGRIALLEDSATLLENRGPFGITVLAHGSPLHRAHCLDRAGLQRCPSTTHSHFH